MRFHHNKIPQETRYQRNISQNTKNRLWQTHNQHYNEWAETGRTPLENRNKTRMLLSPLLFNIILEALATAIS